MGIDLGSAYADVDDRFVGTKCQGHGQGDWRHCGRRSLDRANDRRGGVVASQEQTTPDVPRTAVEGDGIEGSRRRDVEAAAQGVERCIRGEGGGGADIDGAAGGERPDRSAGNDIAITHLIGPEASRTGSEKALETGGVVVTDVGVAAPVHDPHRGDPVGGTGPVGGSAGDGNASGEEAVKRGRREAGGEDASASDGRRRADGQGGGVRDRGDSGVGRDARARDGLADVHAGGRSHRDRGAAVGAAGDRGEARRPQGSRGGGDQSESGPGVAGQPRGFQGGRSGTGGAGHNDIRSLLDREAADEFIRLGVGDAIVAEVAAIEILTGGIGPTALPPRDGTQGVENADRTARAHLDDVVVGTGEGIEEGRAVQTAR